MTSPPPCSSLGPQCRELKVTLRVANTADDSPTTQDATATWLLGHTQRISFGRPFVEGDEVLVDATLHVGCKYLDIDEGDAPQNATNGRRGCRASCAAHGFRGVVPSPTQPTQRPSVRHGPSDLFQVVYRRSVRWLELPPTRAARRRQQRALPVLNGNPCIGAPCRTADNTRGAACCRDLTLDVVAPPDEGAMERFLRSRRSPYVCKVERSDETTIECEMISACAYLDPADGISCVLHDRLLPNNQLAKPSLCREWPSMGEDEVTHPGCRLA